MTRGVAREMVRVRKTNRDLPLLVAHASIDACGHFEHA
jgi:hypothetical protein